MCTRLCFDVALVLVLSVTWCDGYLDCQQETNDPNSWTLFESMCYVLLCVMTLELKILSIPSHDMTGGVAAKHQCFVPGVFASSSHLGRNSSTTQTAQRLRTKLSERKKKGTGGKCSFASVSVHWSNNCWLVQNGHNYILFFATKRTRWGSYKTSQIKIRRIQIKPK